MCDYSLYSNETRLAEDGEELVLHKFTTGTLGFISASDLAQAEAQAKTEPEGFWPSLKALFLPPQEQKMRVPVICIPPGARLLLGDVPPKVQASLCIGSSEIAVFTEVSSRSYSYRDALLLPNGTRVLLQDLPPCLHAMVLSTAAEAAAAPVEAEAFAR